MAKHRACDCRTAEQHRARACSLPMAWAWELSGRTWPLRQGILARLGISL